MRLLDTHTGRFVQFYDITNIRYAILSHTWDPDGEQTYQEVKEIQERIEAHGSSAELDQVEVSRQPSHTTQNLTLLVDIGPPLQPTSGFWDDKKLSEKIRKACEIARSHGYDYIWIDSCCIDKTSSSELSEAINSMYAWYGRAAMCYAFLVDVPQEDVPDSDQSAFRKSRWFRRGWTLQELIAPRRLVFLSRPWQTLGSKSSMARLVEEITRVDRGILTHHLSLDTVSVARRMSWAAERETTRVEDRAYSLLGIFDLNMPTLYGEGERAFRRLQEEILRRIPDQTLFAINEEPLYPILPIQGDGGEGYYVDSGRSLDHYTIATAYMETPVFSSSPSSFIHSGLVDTMSERDYLDLLGLSEIPYPDYNPSPYGIRSSFPVIPLRCLVNHGISTEDGRDVSDWYLVFLSCHRSSELQSLGPHLLARVCRIASLPSSRVTVVTAGAIFIISRSAGMAIARSSPAFTLFTVTANQLKFLRQHVQIRSVCLPHPDRASPTPSSSHARLPSDRRLKLALSFYALATLQANGYNASLELPSQTTDLLWTHSLILRRHDRVLQINIDKIHGPFQQFLSAAAWSFAVADVQSLHFPLSTCHDPPPHDAVEYHFGPGGGFPTIILPEEATRSKGVAIGLDLEEASTVHSSVSHYLHIDIEELGGYDMGGQHRGAFVVQRLVMLRSQAM